MRKFRETFDQLGDIMAKSITISLQEADKVLEGYIRHIKALPADNFTYRDVGYTTDPENYDYIKIVSAFIEPLGGISSDGNISIVVYRTPHDAGVGLYNEEKDTYLEVSGNQIADKMFADESDPNIQYSMLIRMYEILQSVITKHT